jgi:hypothetical protein
LPAATVELFAPSGLALFMRLCVYETHVIAIDNVVLGEHADAKMLYTAAVTGLQGRHTVHVRDSAGNWFVAGDVWMTLSGLCRVHDSSDYVQDLMEADRYIDITASPWQLVLIRKGTGSLASGVVLLRQNLLNKDGEPISSISTFVGRSVAA